MTTTIERPIEVETSEAEPATEERRRLDHVDAMRPIKQAGVVSTHTLLFFAPVASLAVTGSLMLLHVTRESFLFISACMLTYSYATLERHGYLHFYRRRALSVAVPYLVWTAIYFAITLHSVHASGWALPGHFVYLVATGYYQLYYLLVIMEFYLLFPLLLLLVRRTEGHHGALLVASLVVQVTLLSLMHWSVLPLAMRGFWASREVISYQFYLLAGMVAALHLDAVHRWLCAHVRLVLAATVGAAALAEAWCVLAAHHVSWTGPSSDPLQPIVIPFNIAAIASIYLLGVYLVSSRRSRTTRAMVRSGSDDSYGVYLAQMVFVLALTGLGWQHLDRTVPWPVVSVITVVIVFGACVALTGVLARTPLAVALTGRKRESWSTWLPQRWRRTTTGSLRPAMAVSSPIDPDPSEP